MESSMCKCKTRKGKSLEYNDVQNNYGSLEASNHDENLPTSISNGIIDDEDVEDEDPSINYNTGVNFASCKPCSVILERLSEENVRILLSKNNFGDVDKKERYPSSTKPRRSFRACNARFVSYRESQLRNNSKNTARNRSKNLKSWNKLDEVESRDYSDKTIQLNGEPLSNLPGASSSTKSSHDKSCVALNEEKLSLDNSIRNQADRDDASHTNLEAKDSSEIVTSDSESYPKQDSRSRVRRRKSFSLSLKKKITHLEDNDDCPSQETHTNILESENPEELTDTDTNIDGSERTLSLLKRLRFMLKRQLNSSKEKELRRPGPSVEASQNKNTVETQRRRSSSTDSRPKVATQKRFRLSLKTKRVTKKDETCQRDSSNEILQREDSNRTSESSTLEPSGRKRLVKRKLTDTEDVGAPVCKVKKSRKQSLTRNDCGEPQKLASLSNESNISTRLDQIDTLEGSELVGNNSLIEDINNRAKTDGRFIRNLKISIVKLGKIANPSMSKKVVNDRLLDRSVDLNVDKPSSDDLEGENSEAKEKDLGDSCFNKTRDTKITDYFCRVNKSSLFAINSHKNLCQRGDYLIQKKKHGTSKDATILLIDLKNLKIPGSRYLASKIEELTREYVDSFPDINFTNTRKNALPSSSISPNINLPTISNELITNEEQSSTSITHSSPIHVHVDKSSHNSLQTHSLPVPTRPSPESHRSPRVIKHTPIKSTQDITNREQLITDFPNLLSVHHRVNEDDHDSLQTHRGPIRDKPSRTNCKLPRGDNHTPGQNIKVPLDDNLTVNSRTPRSRKDKESLYNIEQPNDCSAVNDRLVVCQNIPDGDFSHETYSSDSQTKNNVNKSLKKPNSHVRKLALSPTKPIVSVNEEIQASKPQGQLSCANNESPKTNEAQKSRDSITPTDISETLPHSNELNKEPNAASINNPSPNSATSQSDTYPILPNIRRSPIKEGKLRIPLKHGESRRLPVNSMTILSREILEEQNSWIGFDHTEDNVAKDSPTISESRTKVGEKSSDDTRKSIIKTACEATNSMDNNSTQNITPVEIVENLIDANLSKDTTELSSEPQNMNSPSGNLVARKSISPKRPAPSNIETLSSEVNTVSEGDTVQKKLDDIQGTELVAVIGASPVNVSSLELVQSPQDPIVQSPVERINRDEENSKSQEELQMDSQQEGQLVIDTDENESESQQIEDVPSSTSVSSRSSSSVSAVVNKEVTKETKVASGKLCILCKKSFKSNTRLEQHLKSHIECTGGACLICDEVVDKNHPISHYLEHCGCHEDGQSGFHLCHICKMKFKTKSGLASHKKHKHNNNRKRTKIDSEKQLINVTKNKCDVCHKIFASEEELWSHLIQHTTQELQDAFRTAIAEKDLLLSTSTIREEQSSGTSDNESPQDKEQVPTESREATTDTSLAMSLSIPSSTVSICKCHQDERLEISGGVIIEIALACIQCKIFFKTRKCFKDHYNIIASKCSDRTSVSPKMFCNKCCVILNSLPEMQEHLKKHDEGDVRLKASILCKRCNIFFFGSGSLFYSHWTGHCKDTLFIADHNSFPNKMKVKIVEPGGPEAGDEDEPTECLFLADYQCQNCEKPFQTEADLKEHRNSSNSCSDKALAASQVIDNPKPFFKIICSMCHKEFIDKPTFDSHMKEHAIIQALLGASEFSDKSLENDQFTCNICASKYDTITDYKNHLIRHEIIREKFECSYCNLIIVSIEEFERHLANHEGIPEKPVKCKVIFAMAKFHCQLCKLWFENQSQLDQHKTMHGNMGNMVSQRPNSVKGPMTEITPVTEKENHVCTTCQQEFDDKLKLDAHVLTHETDVSDRSMADNNPVLVQLSDDSNSSDVEIITTNPNEENQEPPVGNNVIQEQRKTADTSEIKKPRFLRVKNLKELLPYACSKCKSEFDTQINLSKHVCTPNAKAQEFKYSCRICKRYQCDDKSDLTLHMLSHYPPKCSQKFNDAWIYVLKMPNGQTVLRCRICPAYESSSIHVMQLHFIINHPNIYHPVYECRICHIFKSDVKDEMRQHEAAHFRQQYSFPPLPNSANNLPYGQPVEKNKSSVQPFENIVNSQQLDSTDPTLKKLFASCNQLFRSVDSPNNFQQVSNSPITTTDHNSPSLRLPQNLASSQQSSATFQAENNSNNSQQSVPVPPSISSGGSFSTLNLTNFQQSSSNLPVTTSGTGLRSFRVMKNFDGSPSVGPTRQCDSNLNASQQSIAILPAVTNSKSDQQPLQSTVSSNNFQAAIWIPSVTGSCNNSTPLQQLPNFNNSRQQTGPIPQGDNNSNNFQPSVPIPPVTSSGSNLSSLQPTENTQWLAATAQTLQIQINNAPPFNNMTNMMHALPLYVADVIYTCRICKNFKCSNEQDLKAHETIHELMQLSEASKKFYRCKVCTDIFCPTEENLKAHMDMYHKSEKSDVPPDQTQQSSVTDSQIKCKHCHETFASSTQLTQHMYANHTSLFNNQQQCDDHFQNTYPYNCQICSIGFLNEPFLHAHMRQIHPGVKLSLQNSNDAKTLYQCDTCGLLLISEATLKYHMKSHNLGYL